MKRSELKQLIKEIIKEDYKEDYKTGKLFNIAAETDLFGDMIKNIIIKKPNAKYLRIDGFDGKEIYGVLSIDKASL